MTKLVAVLPAQAHSGPPSGGNWHKCSGTAIFGGDSWQTVNGVIHAPRNTAMNYYVRITPAIPFGWSGTAVLNSVSSHNYGVEVWSPYSCNYWT